MSSPCEWCVSTTETLDSQEYEIEQLKNGVSGLMAENKCQAKEISELKLKNNNMRRECNKRYGEQLQKIRKLQAQVMLQVQEPLFKEQE